MAGSHWTSTGGAEFTAIELINFIFLKGCEVRCYIIESQLHLSLIKAQGILIKHKLHLFLIL